MALGAVSISYINIEASNAISPLEITIIILYFRGVEAIASSIAVCTTSSDISLWMRCLLSALISDDCEVVAQEIAKRAMEGQVLAGDMFHSYIQRPQAPVSLIIDAYGMGWFTGYYRGKIANFY